MTNGVPNPAGLGSVLPLAVCAEYLIGYDDSTGDAVELLGGLMIFGPLYGAMALIIREVAVRLGLGWGGIAGLAAAAGLVQAGLIDQSLFNLSYRDISSGSRWFSRRSFR